MSRVAVVTDTTHYLPPALLEQHGIEQVPLYVHWDGRQDRESDLPDFDAFYDHLRSAPELPTTSQPSVGDFLAVWEPLLDAGHDIVSVHIAQGLSGTVGSAGQARADLATRDYDAGRVHIVDSSTTAGGLGCVVLAAAGHAAAGLDAAAVVEAVRRARAELKVWFALDTLEFLKRGGRIGAAQALLGTTLRIKPILTFETEVTPVERVRTSARARERLRDYLTSRQADGADGWIVQHIQAGDGADALVEEGRRIFGCDPLFCSQVGPVVGTHTGPGLLGVGGLPQRLLRP